LAICVFAALSTGGGGGGPLGGVFSFNEPDGSTIDYLANCVVAVVGSDNDPASSENNNADEIVASFIANSARGEVRERSLCVL